MAQVGSSCRWALQSLRRDMTRLRPSLTTLPGEYTKRHSACRHVPCGIPQVRCFSTPGAPPPSSPSPPGAPPDRRPNPRTSSSGTSSFGGGADILADADGARSSKVYIIGYDGDGFDVRDVKYRGSILAFPKACFLWNARVLEDITIDSLRPVLMVKPPIEVLFIGCGRRISRPIGKELQQFFASHGVAVEMMDTVNATATFNILNGEDRRVAAALLAVDAADESPSQRPQRQR